MRLYIVILLFVCHFSCKKSNNYDYNFPDNAYIDVMADLYIAEQIVRNNGANKDSISSVLKEQIFKLHGIVDTSLFNEDFRRLMADTKKYKMIGDSVVKKLENQEIEVRKKKD